MGELDIIVVKERYVAPFSRGILSHSITKAGMEQFQAHRIAEEIKENLIAEKRQSIESDELRDLVYVRLKKLNPTAADRYLFWQTSEKRRAPIIVLIGGSSGVGTSTVAASVANRLGIRHVIGTDLIREVLRKTIAAEVAPALHRSSFEAWEALRLHGASFDEDLLMGFREQVGYVVVGVEAIIERAIREGTSIVIEGVHLFPGLINPRYLEMKKIHLFILHLDSEEDHVNRYHAREEETQKRRPAEHYINHLQDIRRIQEYMVKNAESKGLLCINNKDIDTTTNILVEKVIQRTLEGDH